MCSNPLSVCLLVSHGSRNPQHQQSLDLLASLVSEEIGETQNILIATATLEVATMPLHQAICNLAQKVRAIGLKRINIYPLFLLPGVHVTQDLPTEVKLAQESLGDEVKLELLPHLGSQLGLIKLLQRKFDTLDNAARILLSHGSKLEKGNQEIEKIASQLQALPAYWAIHPSLEEQINLLVTQGVKTIAIVPFFLFAKGIREIIAQQIQQLQQENVNLRLLLGETLGATPELAQVIREGIEKWNNNQA